MSFFRPKYSMKEINEFMAQIARLQADCNQNATNYRLSQKKRSDGSYARDEAYRELHEQQLHNLSIANMTLERILSRVAE